MPRSQSLRLRHLSCAGVPQIIGLFVCIKVSVPLYWQIDTHMNDESLREGHPLVQYSQSRRVQKFCFRDFGRLEASETGARRSHDASQGLLPLARPGAKATKIHDIRLQGWVRIGKFPNRTLNAVSFGLQVWV